MCKKVFSLGKKCRKKSIFEDYCKIHIPKDSKIECCICYYQVKWDKILNCKHPICDRCLNRLRDDKCPICRNKLEGRRIKFNLLEKIQLRKIEDKKEREMDINIDNIFFQIVDILDIGDQTESSDSEE